MDVEKRIRLKLLHEALDKGDFGTTRKLFSQKEQVFDDDTMHKLKLLYKQKTNREICEELNILEVDYIEHFLKKRGRKTFFYYFRELDKIMSVYQYAYATGNKLTGGFQYRASKEIRVTEDFEHVDQVIEKYRKKAKNEIKR